MPSVPSWVCDRLSTFKATDFKILQRLEWEQWQEVVKLLKETGAVTEEDCSSPLQALDTPGQRLFRAVIEWGSLRSELEFQYAHRPK